MLTHQRSPITQVSSSNAKGHAQAQHQVEIFTLKEAEMHKSK